MALPSEIQAEAENIRDVFVQAGAQLVETDLLQRADVLLDLYGEDIRGRAYVVQDPSVGEMMLRPDFTVPVVQMHMAERAEPARYAYVGKIFRKQEDDPDRPREYLQVGYELFDRTNPAASDAEVFVLVTKALSGISYRAIMGDLGILTAAVRGLRTSDRRKAALMRHIWRPARFRALLDRFGGRTAMTAKRQAMLDGEGDIDSPIVGLRSAAEIEERLEALRQDAKLPPISAEEMAVLDRLIGLQSNCADALTDLRSLAADFSPLNTAVETLDRRLGALSDRGIDISNTQFEAAYGRSSMEYYDGFVFGIYAGAHAVPVATGGRYDALTQHLGSGNEIPAVGAVIRPGLTATLREAQP